MNISLQSLSLIFGSVAGVLAMLTIRHPVMSLVIAVIATFVTEAVIRMQKKS